MTAGLRNTALLSCLGLGVADLVLLNVRVLPRALDRAAPVTAPLAVAPPVPLPPPAAPVPAPPPLVQPVEAAGRVPPAVAPAGERAGALARVTFETGVHHLDRRARKAVDVLAARLARSRGVTIFVEGHADQRGADAVNDLLSRRRAEEVAARLAAHGVRARIAVHANGAARPLSDRRDPVSLRRNRRVEIIVRGGTS